MTVLKSLAGFGRTNLMPLLIALAAFGAGYALIQHKNAQIANLDRLRGEERSNHLATRSNFRIAMAEAEAANLALVRAEETKRDEITQRSANDVQIARNALDRRFDEWMRRNAPARAAAGRDPGQARMPAIPGSTRGAAQAAPDARPVSGGADPSGRVCIPAETALTLSGDAINHDGLIDWVIAQIALDQAALSPAAP